jgi:DNA-binding PadR family transcriptional regulator
MHGYDLHQVLIDNVGMVWHVRQSQTYSTLDRLERRGLIVGDIEEQANRPQRKVNSLTAAGRQRADKWLVTPGRCSVQIIRMDLPVRLFILAHLAPRRVPEVLADQRQAIFDGYMDMNRSLAAIPPDQPYNRMAVAFRVHQVWAMLEWLDHLLQSYQNNSA